MCCKENTMRAFNIRLLRVSYRQRKIIEHNATKIYSKSLVLLLLSSSMDYINSKQSTSIPTTTMPITSFSLIYFFLPSSQARTTAFQHFLSAIVFVHCVDAMDMTVLSRNFLQNANRMKIIAVIIGFFYRSVDENQTIRNGWCKKNEFVISRLLRLN